MTFFLVTAVLLLASVILAHLLKISVGEALPTSIFSSVLFLYVFGLFGALFAGLIILAVGIIAALMWILIRGKFHHRVAFTLGIPGPAIVYFILFAAVSYFLTRYMVFTSWDEFSHWGRVVKAMYSFDTLSPSISSDLVPFRSYPPASAILEYAATRPSPVWREENAIWVYQLTIGALFIPFVSHLRWRLSGWFFLTVPIMFLAPLVFFNSYTEITIEPLLACVFGYVLALGFVTRSWTWNRVVQLSVAVAFLALLKDSGQFLAVIALLVYAVRVLSERAADGWLVCIKKLALPVVSMVAAVQSWKLLLSIKGIAVSFSAPIDLGELWKTLAGDGEPYRQEVISSFQRALNVATMTVHGNGIVISWLLWMTLLAAILMVFSVIVFHPDRSLYAILPAILVLVGGLSYQFGLLVLYLFRFSEFEATMLASFSRYLSTYLGGVVVLLAMGCIYILGRGEPSRSPRVVEGKAFAARWFALGYLFLLLLVVPIFPLVKYATEHDGATLQDRAPYVELAAMAAEVGVTDNDSVWIISQHTKGLERQILGYTLLPIVTVDKGWSLGSPKDEGDIWTDTSMTPEEFARQIGDVDFVVFETVTPEFVEEFGDSFAAPGQVESRSIYRVESQAGVDQLVRLAD